MVKTRQRPYPNKELFRTIGQLLREDPKVIEARFMRARRQWREKLEPLVRADRECERLTEKDLSLIVR
jgi:hypothetical protein